MNKQGTLIATTDEGDNSERGATDNDQPHSTTRSQP